MSARPLHSDETRRTMSLITTSLVAIALGAIMIFGIAFLLLETVFSSAADRRAVMISAEIAYAVQLVGFGLLARLRTWNVMAAWGLTALLRFSALAVYALVGLKALRLPPLAALCTLVTLFFATTLAEPWLLRS